MQRSDGFWNVNLADSAHLPGPETSGTAFFTYGLAYGIRSGLDRTTYLPVVARAWNGMVATAVRSDGLLRLGAGRRVRTGVQHRLTAMAAALRTVQRSDGFLYAGTEVAALTG